VGEAGLVRHAGSLTRPLPSVASKAKQND